MVAYTDYESDSRVRREAEALVARGETVDAICLRNDSHRSEYQVDGVNVFTINVKRYRGDGKLSFFMSYLKFFLLTFIRLTLFCFSRKHEIVHVHNIPDSMVFTALFPKIFGAKIILDLHDPMPEGFMVKFKLSMDHPLIRFLRWQEVVSARFADEVICVSEQHKRLFVSHGVPDSKLTVIMNLPDERIFRFIGTRTKSDRFELAYHGTLAHRLGIDIAIRAVDVIRYEVTEVMLNIYGSGESYPFLRNLIEELDVGDHVHLTGTFHPTDEIASLVGSAHAGIVPNRRNMITDLMMPVKLMEYIALGIPVIATRLDTIEYYFDDMVCLFDPGDYHDLANCILEFYYKPDKAESLAEKARSFLEQYNWESEQERYTKLVDKLVPERC